MMKAKELLDQGKLSAAIQQLTNDVRARPTDLPCRIFLFELLCFAGDLSRAEKQLDAIGHQDAGMLIGVEVYRQILKAEEGRRAVFAEDRLPCFLTTPPEYVTFYLEALKLQREAELGKARLLLEKALELQPALAGQANGQPFQEFEDSDPFLGPFLELVVNEKYAWLPFEQIRRIEIAKPEQLRDLVWARARLEARGGDLGQVFLPVLYPGSNSHDDEQVRLGRRTDWIEKGEGLVRGMGQRMFLVDGQERAMLELSEISFADAGEGSSQ